MGECQSLRSSVTAALGNIRLATSVVFVMKTRLLTALFVASMALAACGGESAPPSAGSIDPVPTSTPQASGDQVSDPEDQGTETQSPPDSSTTGSETTEPTIVEEEPPLDRINGPFPESQFPDAIVEDLAGGQVNTKYLGTLERPVLLWFWAPH